MAQTAQSKTQLKYERQVGSSQSTFFIRVAAGVHPDHSDRCNAFRHGLSLRAARHDPLSAGHGTGRDFLLLGLAELPVLDLPSLQSDHQEHVGQEIQNERARVPAARLFDHALRPVLSARVFWRRHCGRCSQQNE